MVSVMTVSALSSSSSSLMLLSQSSSMMAASGGRTTKRHQRHQHGRFIHENAIERQRQRRLHNTCLCHSLLQHRPPIMTTTTTTLSAAYDIQVTSPSQHQHHHQQHHQQHYELEHRNDYYHTSAIGNDLNEVQVFDGGGSEFFGDYGSSATLLALEEEMASTEATTATTSIIDVDSAPWSVVSSTSTAVDDTAVVEDDDVAQTSKVADIVNSINRSDGGTVTTIGETATTSPPSSSSSSSSLSTSGVAKMTVIGDDEKAQGVVTKEATTTKATTTTIDTSATKVDNSFVKENANGIINKVGGDKLDIVMEKEKVVNDFLSSEIAKDTQQRNNDKVRFNIDRDIETQEMEERKVRMRRLADDRLAADIAESKLREEREALDKLVAIRDARQSTIDALRLAIDKATREQMKMSKDESVRQTKLETILENAERAQILSLEKERMLRLDMKLARVEAIALEERIETIRDSMHKLEVEQEGTRSMLEEKIKTMTTATMPPIKATTSKILSVSRASKSNVKSISSDDRVVKKLSLTSTTSSSMLDIPDKMSIIATGALVLGSGIGAVLFLNTPKDEKDEDGGANNAAMRGDSLSSSIPASPNVSVSREDRYSRTIFDRSSGGSTEGGTHRGQEQKQGRSATDDQFGKEQVTSFGEVRSFSTFRSKPITDSYDDTTSRSDAFSGSGNTIGPPFGVNNSAGGKTTSIVTSGGGTGSGFTPSSTSMFGNTPSLPGQRSTSSIGVGAGIGERSESGGGMPIAKGKESNGRMSPPFSSGTGSGFGGSGTKESTNKMASSSQFSGSGFGGGGMTKAQSSGFNVGSSGMPVKGMSASVPSNNIGVGAGFGERSGGMPTMKGAVSSGVPPPISSSTGSGGGGMMKESTNSGSGFGGGGMMKTQSSGFTAGASGIPVKSMSTSDSSSLFGKGSPNSKSVGSGFTSKMINQPATGSAFVKQSYTSQLTSGTTANGINKGSTGFSSSPQSPMSGGPSSFPGVGSSSDFLKGGVKSSTTTLDSKVSSPPGFGGVSKGVSGFGMSSSGSLNTMKGEQTSAIGGSPFGGSVKSSSSLVDTKSSSATSLSSVSKGVSSFDGGLDSKISSLPGFGGVSKGVPGFGISSSGSLGAMKGGQKSAFGGSPFEGSIKSSSSLVDTKSFSPTGLGGANKGVPAFVGGAKSSVTTLESKVSPSFGGVSKGVPGFGMPGSLGAMKGEQKSAFGVSSFGGDKSNFTSLETKSSFPTGSSPSFGGVSKGVSGSSSSSNFLKGGVKSSVTTLDSKVSSSPGFGGVSKGVPGFGMSLLGSLKTMKGEQNSAFGGSSFGGSVKSSTTTLDSKISSPPGFGEVSKGVPGFGTSSSGSLGAMKGEQTSAIGGSPFGGNVKSSSTSLETKSSSATSLSSVSKGVSSFDGGLDSKISSPPGFGGVSKGGPGFGMSSSGSLGAMKGEQKSAFGASPSTTFMPKSFGSEKLGFGFTNEASVTMDMKSSSSSYPGFDGGSSLQSDSAGPSSDTPNVMKGKQTTVSGSSSPSFGTGGMKNMPSLKMMPTPPAFDSDRSFTNDRDLFKSNPAFESSDPRASLINNSRGIPPQSSNAAGRGGATSGRGGPGRGATEMNRGSNGRPGPSIDSQVGGSMLKGPQGRKQLEGYGARSGTSIDRQMLGAFDSLGSKQSFSSSYIQPGSGYSKESMTTYQESMSTFRDMSSFREGDASLPSPLLGNSVDDSTNQIGERTESMRRFRSGEIQDPA